MNRRRQTPPKLHHPIKAETLCRDHQAARVGAAVTGGGAALAVFHFVLRALISADFANGGAEGANFRRELRVPRQLAGSEGADVRTGAIERNATRHHPPVLIRKAGTHAMLTGGNADIAGIDAFEIFHRSD